MPIELSEDPWNLDNQENLPFVLSLGLQTEIAYVPPPPILTGDLIVFGVGPQLNIQLPIPQTPWKLYWGQSLTKFGQGNDISWQPITHLTIQVGTSNTFKEILPPLDLHPRIYYNFSEYRYEALNLRTHKLVGECLLSYTPSIESPWSYMIGTGIGVGFFQDDDYISKRDSRDYVWATQGWVSHYQLSAQTSYQWGTGRFSLKLGGIIEALNNLVKENIEYSTQNASVSLQTLSIHWAYEHVI